MKFNSRQFYDLFPAKFGKPVLQFNFEGVNPEGISLGEKERLISEDIRLHYNPRLFRERHIIQINPTIVLPPYGSSYSPYFNGENSALMTGLYLAGLSFKYAAMKDAAIKEEAQKTLDCILTMIDVAQPEQRLARALALVFYPDQEQSYELAFWKRYQNKFAAQKRGDNPWKQGTDEFKGLRWMGKTKQGQIDGVLFGLVTYYELIGRKEEASQQERIKQGVHNLMHPIIEDTTEKTRELLGFEGWNSKWWQWFVGAKPLRCLAELNAAYRITADEQYRYKFEQVGDEWGYTYKARYPRGRWPLHHSRLVTQHSADNLIFLAYYCLLSQSDGLNAFGEETRQLLAEGLDRSFWEIDPRYSFFTYIYNTCTGKSVHLEEAEATLRQMPIDRRVREVKKADFEQLHVREWPVDESYWNRPNRFNSWRGYDGNQLKFSGVDWFSAYWLHKYNQMVNHK